MWRSQRKICSPIHSVAHRSVVWLAIRRHDDIKRCGTSHPVTATWLLNPTSPDTLLLNTMDNEPMDIDAPSPKPRSHDEQVQPSLSALLCLSSQGLCLGVAE